MYYNGQFQMTLFNNLLSRTYLYFYTDLEASGIGRLNYGNNLLHLGTISLSYFLNIAPYENYDTWTFNNNLFENSTVSESGSGYEWQNYVINDHNAYVNSTALQSGTGNLTLSTADYQLGALGSYYYPTNGTNLETLIYEGDALASAVGLGYSPSAPSALYHYTVTTNNVVEGTNTVSIGFHFVAVGTNGLPLDTPEDGIPDYLADSNGDGLYEPGTDLADWMLFNYPSVTSANGLWVFTPLK